MGNLNIEQKNDFLKKVSFHFNIRKSCHFLLVSLLKITFPSLHFNCCINSKVLCFIVMNINETLMSQDRKLIPIYQYQCIVKCLDSRGATSVFKVFTKEFIEKKFSRQKILHIRSYLENVLSS